MHQKQKILIVDDKKENLLVLRRILADLDVEIVEATSGNEALTATLDQDFAVGILDIMMPGMDGYELAGYLREDDKTRNMPIIFLTAVFSEEERIFKGYEVGAVDYIVKPYNPDVLLSKVRVFLELAKTRAQLAEKVDALTASEQALRASESLYRAIARNFPNGAVYVFDHDLRFRVADGEAMTVLGYTREGLEGKTIWEGTDEETCRILEQRYPRVLAGESLHFETAVKGKVFSSSYVPIRDEDGEVIAGLVVSHDITAQKRGEEQLRRAHDELEVRVRERTAELSERAEQLARLTSELTLAEYRERNRIAEILHDNLQQLLVAAKLNQEALMDNIDNALQPDAKRVLELINDSIRTTRSLSTELSPPILLHGDLSASLEWLAQWMYKNQGFEVKLAFEERIVLDRQDIAVLLFQSIRELLLNALKHSGAKTAAVQMGYQNGNLRITVSDQGMGFDAESIWRNENPFQRFGLISIRERLMYLSGKLELESKPNAGSIISLIVPMNK